MSGTPTPPAVDVAEGRRLLEAQRAATTARWRCERGEDDGHLGDLLQAETRAIELFEEWLDDQLPALLTAAEQVAGMRRALEEIRNPDRACGVPVDSEACSYFANELRECQDIADSALGAAP